MSANPVIFEGARTPFGRHGGAMSRLRVDELAAAPIREVLKRSGLDGSEVEDVILGDTNQAGEDSRNVARNAALIAGLPQKVGGLTVNRLCGSGLAAIMDAGRAIRCGEGDMFIAGGVESMSRAPLVMSKATSAFDRGQLIQDNGCIAIELDQRTIVTTHTLGSTNDDSVIHFTLLHFTARDRIFDADLDNIANTCVTTLGTAQHFNALDLASTAIISCGQNCLHLNHLKTLPVSDKLDRLFHDFNQSPGLGFRHRTAFSNLYGVTHGALVVFIMYV